MPIQGFDPQEFAKTLAQQATEFAPPEFSNEQKNYIVSKVYQFCILAGDAINKDANVKINADQACMITQFIGEWTFHKSVDLIKAKIPSECWDVVLQTIAFAVFEVAKQTQINGLNTEQAVKTVEEAVKTHYEKVINDLAKEGKISQDLIQRALSQSNIDEVSKQMQGNLSKEEEDKALKLASIALLLTTFSKEKAEKILKGMPTAQAEKIRSYMNIQDLDQKLDPNLALQFLNEFKSKITDNQSKIPAVMSNIKNLTNLYTEEEIINTVSKERTNIKEYVENCLLGEPNIHGQYLISHPISKIVYNYIKTQLST